MDAIAYLHERNFGCRINEYTYRGLKTVFMENELLRVGILADKGTDIFEFLHKPSDTDFMWRSYLGVRQFTNYILTSPPSNGPWLDYYEGGWQECLPNAGNFCSGNGRPNLACPRQDIVSSHKGISRTRSYRIAPVSVADQRGCKHVIVQRNLL